MQIPRPRVTHSLRYHPIVILLSIAAVILGVYAIYQLSQAWMSTEMDRLAEQTLNRRAEMSADDIARFWNSKARHPYADPQNRDLANPVLQNLVASQPNVLAAILVDSPGSIRMLACDPKPGHINLYEIFSGFGSIYGIGENELIKSLIKTYPNLTARTYEIGRDKESIGQLILLVDNESHYDLPPEVSHRLATWLGLMLFGVALLIGAALWIIRRQQAVADRLRMQRDKAERSSYVGALAAGLAHEIRNPINALNMQLEMLEEDIDQGDRASSAKRLQRLRDGLAGVEHTVREFLTYATPQAQTPSLVDLAEELETLCSGTASEESSPPIEMKCLVARDLRAWCDPHALRQIVSNLLVNAIRSQRQKLPRIVIRVEAVRQGPNVEVIIDDAGPGIPAGQHETIFEAFYTTHTDGTGLGLAIARRLAEMNGGSLVARPAPSPLGGARFSLTLPAQPKESGA